MARNPEGWRLSERDTGIFHVRFTHKRRRYDVSTRTRDSVEATTTAERIYADVISGQVRKSASGQLAHPMMDIDELVAKWLANIAVELHGDTDDTYMTYGRHWKKHFNVLGGVTSSGIGDYQRDRLAVVQKSTVVKERSALLRFLTWLDEKGYIASVPLFPKIGKKVRGTKWKDAKRRSVPKLALDQSNVDMFLAALDMRSKKHGFLVRPRFVFAYATALRPGLIDNLTWDEVLPDGRLFIPGRFDKNGLERYVPLSPRAQDALKDAGPPVAGRLIFGSHDYREHVAKAKAKLPAHLAREFTPYGLKHARVTSWFRAGKNSLGIQHLTGTKYALDRYAIASEDAAADIVKGD
jgi:integrase